MSIRQILLAHFALLGLKVRYVAYDSVETLSELVLQSPFITLPALLRRRFCQSVPPGCPIDRKDRPSEVTAVSVCTQSA